MGAPVKRDIPENFRRNLRKLNPSVKLTIGWMVYEYNLASNFPLEECPVMAHLERVGEVTHESFEMPGPTFLYRIKEED